MCVIGKIRKLLNKLVVVFISIFFFSIIIHIMTIFIFILVSDLLLIEDWSTVGEWQRFSSVVLNQWLLLLNLIVMKKRVTVVMITDI